MWSKINNDPFSLIILSYIFLYLHDNVQCFTIYKETTHYFITFLTRIYRSRIIIRVGTDDWSRKIDSLHHNI